MDTGVEAQFEELSRTLLGEAVAETLQEEHALVRR